MGTVKYTGPMASFHCPTNAEIRSLKVHFSPKQLGSGDPSPENVRPIVGWDEVEVKTAGKNIAVLPIPAHGFETGTSIYSDRPNGTFENLQNGFRAQPPSQSTGVYALFGYVFAGITYTISFNSTFDFSRIRIEVRDNDSFNETATTEGDGRSFSTGWKTYNSFPYTFTPSNNGYLWGCFHQNTNPTSAFIVSDIQLELASSAPYYEPYQGSTTNYEFGVLGKNKLNVNGYTQLHSVSLNNNYLTNTNTDTRDNFQLSVDGYNGSTRLGQLFGQINIPTGAYSNTFVLSNTYENMNLIYIKHNGITRDIGIRIPVDLVVGQTYTISMDVTGNDPTTVGGLSFGNIQLELGSTATEYESYDPNHTVYGGWVDLITGEVCEEWKSIALESLNWSGSSTRARASNSIDLEIPSYTVAPDFIAEKYYAASYSTNLTNYPSAIALGSGGFICYYDGKTLPSDKMVYKLSEPIIYNLAPTQLQTFLGQNNVWSNADYVEVEYDLHETQDILARKQFIIANQPHIIKPAAAPLQNFVTDVVAPLKECKVYFSPVQEGEGDPSPENVRAISGWTGVEIYRTGKNMLDTATSDEIIENWPLVRPAYQKSIEKLPTNLDFTLQANVTKDLGQNISNCRLYMNGALISGKFINTATPLGVHTVTNKPDADGAFTISHNYLGFDSYGATFNNMQLELGTTATDYEPYSGTTLPIDWTTEAGTIYGGYVDLVTGEVWKAWDIIDLGTCTWVQYNNNPSIFYTRNLNNLKEHSDQYTVLCTAYPYEQQKYVTATNDKTINDSQQLNLGNVAIRDTNYTNSTPAEFKEAMNGIICAYKLATPILITTLTPTQLKTLRGTNNIWSSASGDIQVKYWSH